MSNGFPVFTDFRFVRLDDTLNWLKSLVGLLVSCLFNPLRVMPHALDGTRPYRVLCIMQGRKALETL